MEVVDKCSENGSQNPTDKKVGKKIKRKKVTTNGTQDKTKKKRKVSQGEGEVASGLVDTPDELLEVLSDPEDEPGSIETGDEAFKWMISPIDPTQFYKTYFEKKPLYVKRSDTSPGHYKDVFSTKALEKIIREQRVLYGKHLDITSYDGKRETHNPAGRVYAPVMWDYYNNGSSIRMINPQYFHNAVWRLCATLQDHFQNMVGANVYLTPPGTQGFAPHWDDVEVFMLQLEGKKHWKLYENENRLPRYSSRNLSQEELGKPILETDLEPGDLLYLPRGTIHQGKCLPGHHSLHITISAYQLNSWTDLLEKLLPAALAVASQEDPEFREGLPRNFLQVAGIVNSDSTSSDRKKFMSKVEDLMGRLFSRAPVDAAVDQLGKKLMHDILPPALEVGEKMRTVTGDGEKWHSKKACVINRVEIDPDTRVRLIRSTAIRLVQDMQEETTTTTTKKEESGEEEEEGDSDTVRIYYSTENTREYHEVEEPQYLVIDADLAPAVEALVTRYPDWTKVEDLPVPDLEDRMKIVGDLWERGILMTSEPLEAHYDDP